MANPSLTALTEQDAKPWAAIPSVIEYVRKRIGNATRVLDVGAGLYPFPYATHTVDVVPRSQPNLVSACANFRLGRLPFEDKSFDFVYCRHTVEDLDDPAHLLNEIKRVGKRGYIETPSPLAELCRGIDGGSPAWRGYWHHRNIVWVEDGKLMILPKLALLEHSTLNDEMIVRTLRQYMPLANTYFFWENDFEVKFVWDEFHLKHELKEPHTPYNGMVIAAAVNGHAASAAAIGMMSA